MYCKYAKIDKADDLNRNRILCTMIDNKPCGCQRYCKTRRNYVHTDNHTNCYFYLKREEEKLMKKGLYKVAYGKRGKLHVIVGDQILLFDNKFDEVPTEVELVKVRGEYYLKGFEPKPQAKKTKEKVKVETEEKHEEAKEE